jgi:hypothetical protein
VAVGRERLAPPGESCGRRSGEAWDGREAVADVGQPLEDGPEEGVPGGGPSLIGGEGRGIAEGGEEVIRCLVGDMVPEGEFGLRSRGDAEEALVSLDLANSAPC